jgi:enediyne biosynthesis protein E4
MKQSPFLLCLLLCACEVEALDWQGDNGVRSAAVAVPSEGKTGFSLLPSQQTGVTFSNQLSDTRAAANRVLENGSGVALGDIDGDGLCDVYFCRLGGPNALYRNLGNWKFQDMAVRAGVACSNQNSTGATFADVDGDGDLDLLVNAIGGGTRLFFNDRKGQFTESSNSGLDRTLGSTSLALADADGDGDLDLYVANYRTTTFKDNPPGVRPDARRVDGKIVVTPEDRFTAVTPKDGGVMILERGEPDMFYLNDGKGKFTAVSWTGGSFLNAEGKPLTEPPREWGLSVMFRDFNGDGAPDLYVCNDFFYSPDNFWLNDGRGKFRAISPFAWRNMSMSSMAIDVADINRDGHDDLFVADMLSRDHVSRHRQRANARHVRELRPPVHKPEFQPELLRNTLHLNRGDNTYAEIAQLSRVHATEWTWSAAFMDVDLDGFEDLLITNGNLHDVLDADTLKAINAPGGGDPATRHLQNLLKFPRIEAANLCFRNRRDLTFEEVGAAWGFNTHGISHGMALGDLDNDGDLDVVVNNLNQVAGIYRNDSTAPRVAVRLKGKTPNNQGVGAKIKVLGAPVPQSQSVVCGGRYISGDDAVRTFAAASVTNGLTIEVTWRNGRRSVVSNVEPNRIYEVVEAGATEIRKTEEPPTPLFEDVSNLIVHRHQEEEFNDFATQPLLPKKLSTLGPGLAWFDVDGNGSDDLIIGTGKGGQLTVFTNDSKGGFGARRGGPLEKTEERDLAGLLGWRRDDGQRIILAAASNYEDGTTNGAMLRIYDFSKAEPADGFRARTSAAGPLAMADIDSDGDLDLFLGSRALPRGYPEPVSSVLFRNDTGRFRPDTENSRQLSRVGMVSAAVFSDLDGDADADLLLACEWGPLKLFRNERGNFTAWNAAITGTAATGSKLSDLTGWWNGAATGDFDNDGRLDIVASNWGQNSKCRQHIEQPLRIYWGNLSQLGGFDVFEAYFDSGLKKVVPWTSLDVLSRVSPFVQEQFPSHRAYGSLGIDEILGANLAQLKSAETRTLDSTLFLNRGNHFEVRPLPVEAQFAPAFAVCIADADGDGNEDVFLSQNFFDTEPETSRYDAGRGLWLRGNGRGDFTAMPGQQSGIKVYGQQRGAALCDFDQDGRVDLALAQNGGETKLFRNITARAGLRVRLEGPAGNPQGIGAVLRLQSGSRQGPLRGIHAGSGYWSQESAIQVLARLGAPETLTVRWPGGQGTTINVPENAREVVVGPAGLVNAVPR